MLLLLGFVLTLHAQEAKSTAGGDALGSGGSASYTVGQVVYTTITGGVVGQGTKVGVNSSMAQGIQQSYDITSSVGIDDGNGITLECSVYPNPTTDNLILKIENKIQAKYIASLYDLKGKLVLKRKVEDTETIILMKPLVKATYILKIMDTKKIVKTFKVIKN
jgi:hypothetical protein